MVKNGCVVVVVECFKKKYFKFFWEMNVMDEYLGGSWSSYCRPRFKSCISPCELFHMKVKKSKKTYQRINQFQIMKLNFSHINMLMIVTNELFEL